jgi:hypothetical protein
MMCHFIDGHLLIIQNHFTDSFHFFLCSGCELDLPHSCVSQLVPVKRFSFLLSHIHLKDNSVQPSPSCDRLYKIRPLLHSLSQPFFESYKP